MKRLSPLPLFIILCCAPIQALAGLDFAKADDQFLFTKGGYSVIVAEVHGVMKLPQVSKHGSHSATLRPLATLAGAFDATSAKEIQVEFFADTFATSIKEPPPPGSTIMVVIAKGNPVPDLCDFMPESSAMVVVSGLGDKRVAETIERLRAGRALADARAAAGAAKISSAARAAADAEKEKAAATRPDQPDNPSVKK